MSKPTSIEVMKQEIDNQPLGLGSYARSLLANRRPPVLPSKLTFSGSGDMYSAALWARELSHDEADAYDPFELALKPSKAKDKHVFILSVSGRTRANLFLARRLKGVANRRIAVTSSLNSVLATECDETLFLEYKQGERLTAGTASYTSTILVCSRILGQMPALNLEHTLRSARVGAEMGLKDFSLQGGTVVFVGSGIDYPLALYGGLKFNEVLGMKSCCSTPEQLAHALIFSLDNARDRIIMIDPSSNRRCREIRQVLSDSGFFVYSLDVPPQNPLVRSFEIAFHLQYLVYNVAVRAGLEECAFLSNEKKLDISNRLIY